MNRSEIILPHELHSVLTCNFETGKLYWKHRSESLFAETAGRTAKGAALLWNSRWPDKEAFSAYDSSGYRHGLIFSKIFKAHRVIWAMRHGFWPKETIDHINGIRDDNRIINLREASLVENARNQKMPSRNTSGRIGVYQSPTSGLWCAAIRVGKKKRHLGTFDTFDQAAGARHKAEIEFGFHPNHGRA